MSDTKKSKQKRRMQKMQRSKRKKPQDTHMDESWLVPYADILTLLLALFIVLFAMSTMDGTKAAALSQSLKIAFQGSTGVLHFENPIQPQFPITDKDRDKDQDKDFNSDGTPVTEENIRYQEETIKLNELAEQLQKYLEENDLTGALTTEVSEQGLKITIEEKALFHSGRADILPNAGSLARQISYLLEEVPYRQIVISGHTDNVPMNSREFKSNWELSSARANNFLHVVLENPNLDVRNFKTEGNADNRPVDTNDTAEGRAKNRRVEIMIERIFSKNE